MDDRKQESKKTVVAFVVGLLIGGLLVWMFSGTPEASAPDKVLGDDTKTTTFEENKDDTNTAVKAPSTEITTPAPTSPVSSSSNFTFNVGNQKAGNTVSLGTEVKYPSTEGWIVVHEDVNGQLGSALGAARYNTDVGLTPEMVDLLRGTTKGKTYRVVYYTQSGDIKFDLKEDKPMTKTGGGLIEATFMAE